MATLQKIRSNKAAQIAIGLGMLAFVAGGIFTMVRKNRPEETPVASINGKEIKQNELSQMTEDYKTSLEMMAGTKLPSEAVAEIREYVFQRCAQQQILEEECEKLGLTVTDEEVGNVLKAGTHRVLLQSPFAMQGTFDITQVKQIIKQYKDAEASKNAQMLQQLEPAYTMWCNTEAELKYTLLAEKYAMLLGGLMMTNPVSAKASFDAQTEETDIYYAALPYSSLDEASIKKSITDSELQTKYNEYKEGFFTFGETRDIKYIDVAIKASEADKAALDKEMRGYADSLNLAKVNVDNIVRQAQSTIPYFGMPVSKNLFQNFADITERLDSTSSSQSMVYDNIMDNTKNVVKILNHVVLPDTVEYRAITIQKGPKAKAQADSICLALNNGTPFDSIASSLKQKETSAAQKVFSAQYESQLPQMDAQNRDLVKALMTSPLNTVQQHTFDNGILITKITAQSKMIDKYDVAIIKRPVQFSDDTYNKYKDDLTQFIAKNKTIEDIEKNQTIDYTVRSIEGVTPMSYTLNGIPESRDVIKWAFEEGVTTNSMSDVKDCGTEHDHLVVAVVTGTHAEGYKDLKNNEVKNIITNLVLRDKMAAELQQKMKSANSVADVAKIEGAVTDSIQQITFAAPTFVTEMGGASENTLNGAVCAAKQGSFVKAVRGDAGVYAFQVIKKSTKEGQTYDEKAAMESIAGSYMNYALQQLHINTPVESMQYQMYGRSGVNPMADMKNPSNVFHKIYKSAKREDNRHKFF